MRSRGLEPPPWNKTHLSVIYIQVFNQRHKSSLDMLTQLQLCQVSYESAKSRVPNLNILSIIVHYEGINGLYCTIFIVNLRVGWTYILKGCRSST